MLFSCQNVKFGVVRAKHAFGWHWELQETVTVPNGKWGSIFPATSTVGAKLVRRKKPASDRKCRKIKAIVFCSLQATTYTIHVYYFLLTTLSTFPFFSYSATFILLYDITVCNIHNGVHCCWRLTCFSLIIKCGKC